MTPLQASKKTNQKNSPFQSSTQKKNHRPKFLLEGFVGTAGFQETFSKVDSTNWSHQLNTIAQIVHDTTPSYRIEYLPTLFN